jgi:hypothetical protein
MRIEFSAEVRPDHWLRVELGEPDLTRLFVEAGADVAAQTTIPTTVAYYLLSVECERLVLARLIAQYKYAGETVDRFTALSAERAKLLEALQGNHPPHD